MFDDGNTSILGMHPILSAAAIALAVAAAAILIWYLVREPRLGGRATTILFFGFAVLPVAAMLMGGVANFEHTTHRGFCASCHVMLPFTADSESPTSQSLAARHARNELFGSRNCYECHRDYGMFSTLLTKWGGMRHVWDYYTEYHDASLERFLSEVELYEPYPNASCVRCHSTEVPMWESVGDHRALLGELRSGAVACMSQGCHGPAHPRSGRGDGAP